MKNITSYIIGLTLGIFLLSSANVIGQTNQIDWGPDLEGKGSIELVGDEGDFLYAIQTGKSILNIAINFIKIDKATLQVVDTKKMDISSFKSIPLDFAVVDSKLHALLVTKGKNLQKITYDLELNEISNDLIKRFDKSVVAAEMIEGASIMLFVDMVTSFRSYDKSKVVVMMTKFGKKRKGVEFYVFDVNSGFSELYSSEIEGVNSKSEERVEDIEILSDGRINILMKQYRGGTSESRNKKPNYDYAIYKLGLDKSIKEELLPDQTTFWKNGILKSLKDGSILVAGLTQLKKNDRPNGLQLIKHNENGETIFNKTHELTRCRKKNKMEKTFYLRSILSVTDNGFVLLTEDAWGRIFTEGSGFRKKDDYYSNDILLDAFDADGEKKWSECIYRRAEESGIKKLLTGPLVFNRTGGISLFYNTIAKNVEVYNSEEIKKEKLPSKKPVVLEVKIDNNGTLSFDKISTENRQHLVTTNSYVTKDKIYFIGARDNKLKKMNIGTFSY